MLCLRREINESILIGDYEVKVLKIEGDTVQLGITAPRDVPILRGELRHRKAKQRCWVCLGTGELPSVGNGTRPCPDCGEETL